MGRSGCYSPSRDVVDTPDISGVVLAWLHRPGYVRGLPNPSHSTTSGLLPPQDAFPTLGGADRERLNRAIPLVYNELRTIAHRHLSAHGHEDTLNSTALVHEAYLKLGGESGAAWNDRAHFFALASIVMRQILIDRARTRASLKHGGTQRRITLEEDTVAIDEQAESLLHLDEALGRLAKVAPRLVRVVEFRFFGGMSEEEIGSVLGVTTRTVRRDWDKARLLLRRALSA